MSWLVVLDQINKMIVLTGTNLNERHKELNHKVNDAVSNAQFEEIRDNIGDSDVDKLFVIDVAAKHKNIDYILEILKCGDSLLISRALKCDWIIDDEFAHLIHPHYLDRNIFPFMAPKMKKKTLATISSRLRNGERAEEFHHYCMRNKMINLGMKFLLYTNETFKIEILTLHPHVYNDFDRTEEYLEHFIGNSFLLAEHYLKVICDSKRCSVLFKLRYLYSVSEDKYLDLLETCKYTDFHYFYSTSLTFSRNIMKKHKNRVLKNPWIYLHALDPKMVTKYSTSEDAKVYAVPFLPDECWHFWNNNYYMNNEFFLKLIPLGERFSFIKKIFTEKYPDEMFEDDYRFYTSQYYDMMNEQEKENWALSQIASEKELHGCSNDYIWYRFVNFQKAFVELKKYILIAPDNDKRTDILKILVESAKNQEELTTLMEYYYNRHINELKEFKRDFVSKIIEKHNVLQFNEDCWDALNKILYSLEVYHELSEDSRDYENNEYRVLSLVYHIIHKKSVLEVLRDFLLSGTIGVSCMRNNYDHYMDPHHPEMIYQYMLPCFAKRIKSLIIPNTDYNYNKSTLCTLTNGILDVIVYFKKKFEDIPQEIRDFIMNKYEWFKYHQLFYNTEPPPKFTIANIMHYLKKDSSLVVSNFSTIKKYFEGRKNTVNWLIKKLKIYFINDLASEYIKLLTGCLSVEELHLHTARVAVYGIINLSDDIQKVAFLEKYAPVDSKIDHVKINRDLLAIHTAICSVACHSRPPLPLSNIREYIKGDYLQFCIPIFDSYLANLTPAQCLLFVDSLLDNPVSIQKHGLRLAFNCFTSENLKNLVLKVWKKTKNVSVRKNLYKALFDKINYHHDNLPAQWELFGALNIMTHDLHQDDDEEVIGLLYSSLPPNVFGQHLQSAYIVVNTFPARSINYQRLSNVITAMKNNIELISKNILLAIAEDHIHTMLDEDQLLNTELHNDLCGLNNDKWSLIKTIIIKHNNPHFIYLITDKTLSNWHKTNAGNYAYRMFYTEFVNGLEPLSYLEPAESYLDLNNVIFQTILTDMENALPHIEIYLIVWRLKLNILTRQVLGEEVPKIKLIDRELAKIPIKETFLKFSREVKNLMEEYSNNKKYFLSLSHEIKATMHDAVMKVKYELDRFVDDGINPTDFDVLLCSVLSESIVLKIQMFVMNFLPLHYHGEYSAEYLDVITKLKSVDDNEIKYFLCHKFYSSDYMYRDFMPLSQVEQSNDQANDS